MTEPTEPASTDDASPTGFSSNLEEVIRQAVTGVAESYHHAFRRAVTEVAKHYFRAGARAGAQAGANAHRDQIVERHLKEMLRILEEEQEPKA